ncbi:MAG: hypothetical protein V4858_12745 [Pseudomonadota bacterium]
MGIGSLSYWDRSFSMADVGRQSQYRGLDWSFDVGADAAGNPGKDFQLIYSATKIGAGVYKLIFTGRATVTTGGAGNVQSVVYDAASNSTSADIVLPGEVTGNVWLMFKDTYRTSKSTKGDGVRNIRLWRPGYATNGADIFTTEFVGAVKKFSLLRTMDLVRANTNPQKTWGERTKPDFFGTTGDNGQSWELLVALANATERDIWLTIPVRADDDYIRKLAQLVKYGSNGDMPYTSVQASPMYSPLKAGLRVYVEYGNEIWNSGPAFKGFGWALQFANANKLDTTHPIAFDGPQADQYTALRRWVAYRSSFVSLTFRDVFGDTAMMTTVRPILASQAGNGNAYLSTALRWAQSFYGQVRQTAPTNAVVRKPGDLWYGGGGAAYYDASVDPKDTNASTMSSYFASLPTPTFAQNSVIDSIWTHAYGLKYVAYEGGPGPGGSSLGSVAGAALSPAFNNDPRMKDRMLIAQDIWDQAGGDELVYYVYSSSAPWSFTNELVQQVVSDTSSVKLQAIDAINAKAKPAVTLGNLAPGTISLKDPASQAIGSDAAGWALNGTVYLLRPSANNPYILLPIRTATAGNYQISFNIGGMTRGTVSLHVNGTGAGTITLSPNASDTATLSSKIAVTLPAGMSVLRLDSPKGSGDIFIKDVVVE